MKKQGKKHKSHLAVADVGMYVVSNRQAIRNTHEKSIAKSYIFVKFL